MKFEPAPVEQVSTVPVLHQGTASAMPQKSIILSSLADFSPRGICFPALSANP
jgi:hypothetical protein